MNESGLAKLFLIHGTKAETLVYTAGVEPRQPLGPCGFLHSSKLETIPTTSYWPLVTPNASS